MRWIRIGETCSRGGGSRQRRTFCGVGVQPDDAAIAPAWHRGTQTRGLAPADHSMGVKPELAFDVCWEVYRGALEVLEAKRGMSAMDWKEATKYLWRPGFCPRLGAWVADSALDGQAALEGPECASRMVLLRLYYLGLAPYEKRGAFSA